MKKRFIRRDRLAAFPFEHPFLLKVKKYGAYVRLAGYDYMVGGDK